MERLKKMLREYFNNVWTPFGVSLSLFVITTILSLTPISYLSMALDKIFMKIFSIVMLIFVISVFGLPVAGVYQLVKKQYSNALGNFVLFILIWVFLVFVSSPFPYFSYFLLTEGF